MPSCFLFLSSCPPVQHWSIVGLCRSPFWLTQSGLTNITSSRSLLICFKLLKPRADLTVSSVKKASTIIYLGTFDLLKFFWIIILGSRLLSDWEIILIRFLVVKKVVRMLIDYDRLRAEIWRGRSCVKRVKTSIYHLP